MSNTNNDTSDVKKAAEHADAQAVNKNLDDSRQTGVPENLDQEEQAPFIDDELRTDK